MGGRGEKRLLITRKPIGMNLAHSLSAGQNGFPFELEQQGQTVLRSRSSFQQVRVLGEVRTPQGHPKAEWADSRGHDH